ncbi:MAG: tripartite tricarboxylate transporter substrate binding protein [Reyranella sp.]|nr:tripartite tricarboxylate transporter substrate binding protein [Reyranella sp.]
MTGSKATRRHFIAAGAAAIATMALPFQLRAESYPGRPITYVVPFPPGATNDNSGRIVARKLGEKLGQTIVVDNKSGGGGSIGAEFVAKSKPDGLTLLNASTGNLTVAPQLMRTGYDPFRDFSPVGYVGTSRSVFAIHPSLPVKTLEELIGYARENPGKLNFGSAGNGSGGHLAGEYLKLRTNIDMVHVPYRGSAAAAKDATAGLVQLMIDPITAPLVRSGQLRGLAVSGNDLRDDLPGVPSIAEAGIADWELSSGFVAVAPAGTPAPVLARLNQIFAGILSDASTIASLNAIGLRPLVLTPEEIVASLKKESDTNRRIIEVAKITAD